MMKTYAAIFAALLAMTATPTFGLWPEIEQWVDKEIPMVELDDKCLGLANDNGCPACVATAGCQTCSLYLGDPSEQQVSIGMYVGCRSDKYACNDFTTYPRTAALFKSTEASPASLKSPDNSTCYGDNLKSPPSALIDILECDKCPGGWCDIVATTNEVVAHGYFCVRDVTICNLVETMKPDTDVELTVKIVNNDDCKNLPEHYIHRRKDNITTTTTKAVIPTTVITIGSTAEDNTSDNAGHRGAAVGAIAALAALGTLN